MTEANDRKPISDSNPHRLYRDGYEVSYWRGGSACGMYGSPDRAEVMIPGRHGAAAEFLLPLETPKLDRLLPLLRHVFEVGRADKARELRAVLGM